MARPHPGDRCRPLVAPRRRVVEGCRGIVVEWLDGHDPGPVVPVAVGDEEEDRRAECGAVADAGEDLGLVLFDRLAGAATVALLSPGKVDRERLGGQREAGRDALDRDAQGRPVRLAGGQETEGTHRQRVDRGSVAPDRHLPPATTAGSVASAASAASAASPVSALSAATPVGSPSAERRPPARASPSFCCISSSGAG